jgi:DNA modification methylase
MESNTSHLSSPYFLNDQLTVYVGDSLQTLKTFRDESVQCCVTSPPYWNLRDYGVAGQLGSESTPKQYVDNLVRVFDEVKRVLKADGTLWLNLGDCYNTQPAGNSDASMSSKQKSNHGSLAKWKNGSLLGDLKKKDLVGIPWMVAFALRDAGWYLRSDIVWAKPDCMPESVRDRPTRSHEFIFLLTKSDKYYYDYKAILEPMVTSPEVYKKSWESAKANHALRQIAGRPLGERSGENVPEGRNKRDVWTVTKQPFKGAHFACFPQKLIEPCILAGSREGDTVLDPFGGAGTTALACKNLNRKSIYIDLNKDYADMTIKRLGYAE